MLRTHEVSTTADRGPQRGIRVGVVDAGGSRCATKTVVVKREQSDAYLQIYNF
jgi:hypothetical protein